MEKILEIGIILFECHFKVFFTSDDNNDEEKSVDDEEGKDDEATIHVQNALAAVSLETQKKKGCSFWVFDF